MSVSIREKDKGSGEWWIFIKHQGRRRSKKVGPRRLAAEVAEKLQIKLLMGDMTVLEEKAEKHSPLFKEYASLWIESYIKPLRRASTYERYKGILHKYLYPAIGQKPIAEIKRSEIRDLMLRHYRKGLSQSSISAFRDVLSGVMGYAYAIEEELIQSNPVAGILKRLNLEKDQKNHVEPFTPEEITLILNTCTRHYPEMHAFLLCAFRTGMRLGELLGLCWDDIDWNGKLIKVQRSFRHRRLTATKNNKVRLVDMSDQLEKALRALYTLRKEAALYEGMGSVVQTVFHRNSNHISQNSIRNVWRNILSRAGLRYRRFHEIRHTYASLLLGNGESPVYVKEQLGHSSIQITVDIYGHLIPSSNRKAVNKLDRTSLSA